MNMRASTGPGRAAAEEVRDNCLCFATHKAARELARHFDRIFAPLGLTHGQFSMMVAITGMGQPKAGHLAAFLAMDRATVTAATKKLEANGFVTTAQDVNDRRARRVAMTAAGQIVLAKALPLWRSAHAAIDAALPQGSPARLRRDLGAVTALLRDA